MSLLSDLCRSKSQQGDLEKRRWLPGRRVPTRQVAPSAAVLGPGSAEPSASRGRSLARAGVGVARTPQLQGAPCSPLPPPSAQPGWRERLCLPRAPRARTRDAHPGPQTLGRRVVLTGVSCQCPRGICRIQRTEARVTKNQKAAGEPGHSGSLCSGARTAQMGTGLDPALPGGGTVTPGKQAAQAWPGDARLQTF